MKFLNKGVFFKTFFAAVFLLFAFAPGVSAFVNVDGHADVMIYADRVVESAEPDGKVYEAYSDSHFSADLSFGNLFSVSAELLVEGEPSGHEHGHGEEEEEEEEGEEEEHEEHEEEGEGGFFTEHIVSVDELRINFKREFGNKSVLLYAGKFRPIVSADTHDFPSMYSYRIAHEYEMESRIGFGGRLGLDGGLLGRHGFDFSAFVADTTIFSNGGSRLRRSDGGVSNTGDLSSFALSLGGGNFFLLNDNFFADLISGLSYRFGYAKQARGRGDEGDESRFSFAAKNFNQFTENLSATLLNEVVRIENPGGHKLKRLHIVSSIGFDWKQWTLAGAWSLTRNTAADDPEEGLDGSSFDFSLARKFGNAKISAGYQRVREEGETTGRLGFLLSLHGDFSSGGGGGGHEGHAH